MKYLLKLFIFALIGVCVCACEEILEPESVEITIQDEPENDAPDIATEAATEPPSDADAANETKKMVVCKRPYLNATAEEKAMRSVEVMNSVRLGEVLTADQEVTKRDKEGHCAVVLFYSDSCPFSSLAAPQFNALARLFPDIKMAAIDSIENSRVNTQYGIIGVPSIILFHNARAVAKFNGSEYSIQTFSKFIRTYTSIEEELGSVHTEDFMGPVPSVITEETDYILLLAWIFVTVVALYYISKTRIFKCVVETVKNTWREAEAQHEHVD